MIPLLLALTERPVALQDLNEWMATLRVGWEACMTYGYSPGVSLTARPHATPAEKPAPTGIGGTSGGVDIVQPQPQRPGGGGARGYGRMDSGREASPLENSPPDGCDSPITESPFLAEKIQRMRRSHSLGMYLARAPNSFVGSTSRGGRMAPFSGQTQGPDDHRFQSLTHRPFTDFLPSHHCRKTPVWRPYGPSYGGAEGEGPEGANGFSYDGSGGRPRGYSACSSDARGQSATSVGATTGEQWRHGVHRSLSFVGGDDFQSLLLQGQDPPSTPTAADPSPRPRQSSHDEGSALGSSQGSLSSSTRRSSSLSASRSSQGPTQASIVSRPPSHHGHSASVERCDDGLTDLPLSPNQLLLLPLAHECPGAMNVPLAATLLRDGGLSQLRDALAKLIQRHPSLRTEYATGLTGIPCQRIKE